MINVEVVPAIQEDIVSEDEALRNADAVNDLRLKIKMSRLESTDEEESSIDQLTGGDSGLSI